MHYILSAFFLFLSASALAGDPSSVHPHQGVAPKFDIPEKSELSTDELAVLKTGESVRKQILYEDGGRGISIMDVKGSADDVWSIITDFGSYPSWVDMLEKAEVYSDNGRNRVKVAFALKVMGINVEYWIDHRYDKVAGYLTWQLDYSKHSDLDDSTGYWYVYPAPDRPGYSRVEYTVDLRLTGFVPKVVEDLLARQGLDKATSWVKLQVEQ